jgi:chemotaxis protein methyltransferase CheR
MGIESSGRQGAPETPLAALAEAVARRTGLSLRACTPEGVEQRLRYRLRDRAFGRVEEYAEYLLYAADGAAWEALVETLTTNDSRFFGDPEDFAPVLELDASPRWSGRLEREGAPPQFRCLCAGSGRGEEAYSLAMALEEVRTRRPSFGFEVIGVDLSARAVALARAGVYPKARTESLPAEWRERHLEAAGESVRFAGLRARVRFARANLATPGSLAPLGRFDLIFARDVLPSLVPAARGVALENLAASLAPDGVLLLGPRESIGDVDVGLWPIRWGERCAYAGPFDAHEPPVPGEAGAGSGTAVVAHRERVARSWLRILLERRGYRVEEAGNGLRALEISVGGPLRERYLLERTLPSRGGPFVGERLARTRGVGPGAVIYIAPGATGRREPLGPNDSAVISLPLAQEDLDPVLGTPSR